MEDLIDNYVSIFNVSSLQGFASPMHDGSVSLPLYPSMLLTSAPPCIPPSWQCVFTPHRLHVSPFLLCASFLWQIDEDQVSQMDLENSLITTWKDTQVLGMRLPVPIMSGTPGLVGLPGSHCPTPDIWGRNFSACVPFTHHLEAPAQRISTPSFLGHHPQPHREGLCTAPMPPALPTALTGRGPHHRGLPGAEAARLLRDPEGESQRRPRWGRQGGMQAQPVPGTHPATTCSSPCVRPQVSPTMTAEELTNHVLEMRNVAASLDIWLTFEALENGELGE